MVLVEKIEQFLKSGERIFDISLKTEAYFYNKLYTNFFHFYLNILLTIIMNDMMFLFKIRIVFVIMN